METESQERESWRVERNRRNKIIFESNTRIQGEQNREQDFRGQEAAIERNRVAQISNEEVQRAQIKYQNKKGQSGQASAEMQDTIGEVRKENATTEAGVAQGEKQRVASNQKTPEKPKLSEGTIILMFGTALLFDAMQFVVGLIPVVGQIVGFLITGFAWGTFALWFKMKNIPFKRNKTVIFELIPLLNMLPAWTIAIASTVAAQKMGGGLSSKLLK